MGKRLDSPKDIVRERSGGCCEKCGVTLTPNTYGITPADTARTIHHRQPQRCGGKDSIVNMVNLCVGCHRGIHDDEGIAQREGWVVIRRYPGNVPFLAVRGWILPKDDGSLTLLDFDLGRAVDLPLPQPHRHRVATRQRHRTTKRVPRVA